jgi:hypothetical protein
MKLSEKSQILLERYLLAVERRLPWQGRKDMVAEIRSNLMDTLEDHYPPEEVLSEDMLEEELRKMGAPGSVASSYYASDALIGPQHNLVFRLIVQYVVPIVAGALLIAGIVSFVVSSGKSPFWSVWELIGNIWQTSVGIIGTAAIILMILTRFFPQVNNETKALEILEGERKNWKVSDLPELVAEKDKVHLWEPTMGIIFGFLGLAFWIFLFDTLAGFWWRVDDQWHMVPIFTEAFKAFIPWFIVNTSLNILLNVWLVYRAQRDAWARMFEMIIKVSEIALVSTMLKAGSLLKFDAALAQANGFPAEGIAGIETLFQYDFVRWFLIFLLVVLSIDLLKNAFHLLKGTYFKNIKA